MTDQQSAEHIRDWMLSYGKLVYSVAYKILKNDQDAEDVLQNTFVKVYFRCEQLKKHENLKAWLCRTAANDALNQLTSSWKKKVTLCEIPVEFICSTADTGEISSLVKNLPVKYKKCIWLYYYAGYKTREIADMTGVPLPTVLTRLKRAREYLKIRIQDPETEFSYEYK